MTEDSASSRQGRDPSETATSREASGDVRPGAIPPDDGQTSGASGDAHKAPNMGPVNGNRTPMIVALVFLAFFVIAIAVITGASFFPSD
ncbi:MAG: DUF6480 family protein [Mycobacteriales bacterium]